MQQGTAAQQLNRTGLALLLATLLVIVAVIVLAYRYTVVESQAQIQQRSVSLARLIAGTPLVPEGHQLPQLQRLLDHQQRDPAFAFGALYDNGGTLLLKVPETAADPGVPPIKDPQSWLEQEITLDADGAELRVFSGAVGERYRFVFGMHGASYTLRAADIPFMAALALPVFLLTPLCLFLLRREVRPMSMLSGLLDEFEGDRQLDSLSAGAALNNDGFVKKFSDFVAYVQGRIDKSNEVSAKLITNERMANYRMARLENVLQALPDGLIWLDEQARVLSANRRALQILGISSEEYKVLPLKEFSAQAEVRAFFARVERGGAAHVEPITVELPAPAPACLTLSAHPVQQPAADSVLIGTVVLLRDATSESLAKRSRSEFIANVAHELKSPLNTLRLYADSLVDDGEDPEIRLEATQIIQDEVDRLATLINNLLNITQIETGSLQIHHQRTHLHSMLEDIVESMGRSDAARALKIKLNTTEVPAVSVDKELLRIAVNNLLSNAIKYSDPGGQINVTLAENNEAISISVADSGIGISADEQAKIFDKFYRAQDPEAVRRGGHGLGLALCREIVQLHHGSLRLESEPGEGSTFVIELWKANGVVQEAI
ncbi:MAG: sensor histidine kinase [Pseudomonadales bacterium]